MILLPSWLLLIGWDVSEGEVIVSTKLSLKSMDQGQMDVG